MQGSMAIIGLVTFPRDIAMIDMAGRCFSLPTSQPGTVIPTVAAAYVRSGQGKLLPNKRKQAILHLPLVFSVSLKFRFEKFLFSLDSLCNNKRIYQEDKE